MTFVVRNIYEEDFGCEGRPEGAELSCILDLRSDTGEEIEVKVTDAELTEKKIDVGDWVYFDSQSVIHKD